MDIWKQMGLRVLRLAAARDIDCLTLMAVQPERLAFKPYEVLRRSTWWMRPRKMKPE